MNYFDEARRYLPSSNCLKRKYAAVIVNKRGHMISVGFNKSKVACKICAREGSEHNKGDYRECHSIHAEQMAMLGVNIDELKGSTMYLVCDKDTKPKPCAICQRMMDWCGVKFEEEQP